MKHEPEAPNPAESSPGLQDACGTAPFTASPGGGAPALSDATADPSASPVLAALQALYREHRGPCGGQVATYIPELAKVDPSLFGICLATVDGHVYEVGDSRCEFTIQSISKPLVYGQALADHGRAFVLTKVGVEPSGDAFNSIVFDERSNRPFNPMVNAGAIATTALIEASSPAARLERIMGLFSRFAGRPLSMDESVFRSERETGHRNRAIAWLERNFGMIDERIDEHLDLYFQQCSVLVTARDLAVMAATLANAGVNPLTGERVLAPQHVRDMLSVMNTCGMYDYAGTWSFDVGLPAKSGVGGGIIGVLPGQFGIGTFSPPLDDRGNSCRGLRVCKALSEAFNLHVFAVSPSPLSVIRNHYNATTVHSKRKRSAAEREILDRFGRQVRFYELQGGLYFASMERLLRELEGNLDGVSYVIFECRRVGRIDASALSLLNRLRHSLDEQGKRLLLSGLSATLVALLQDEAEHPWPPMSCFDDADSALEWCENRLIAAHMPATLKPSGPMPLAAMDIVACLTADEIEALQTIVEPVHYEPGAVIIREGEPADCFYIVGAGSVTVRVDLGESSRTKRLAAVGPGVCFGEIALFDGGRRSADVIAEETSMCYRVPVAGLTDLAGRHPEIRAKLLYNIGRELSDRLRSATAEIRALGG